MVLSIDEVNDLLDTMAEEFPEALFDGLNGGVNLLEEAVPDTEFPEREMYILGNTARTCWVTTSTCTTAPSPPWRKRKTGAARIGRTSCTPPFPMS